MFLNRVDAGQRLAGALSAYDRNADAVVLGIPRGGVVVAAEVAKTLGLPLDIVVASKIGAPGNPEYAVGAVDADGEVLASSQTPVSDAYLQEAADDRRAEVVRRLQAYRGERAPIDVRGRTVLVVDDGIATGLTARAAVHYLRRHGAGRVVVAAPVMPPGVAAGLGAEADELIALATPWDFSAVGQFYAEFGQTKDAEVVALLEDAR